MKNSAKCGLEIFFVMMFAITSTTFGADFTYPQGSIRGTATVNKLPNSIKINTNDVRMTRVDNPSAESKAAWKKVSDAVAGINSRLPLMEQQIAILNNKIEECKNKVYTTSDMSSVGCYDAMSVAECSKLLYRHCVRIEYETAKQTIYDILDRMRNISNLKQVEHAHEKLLGWVGHFLVQLPGLEN